jgi:AcrR family transcriptional regulator
MRTNSIMVASNAPSENLLEQSLRGDGRARILEEARDRFLTNGFSATSMQEIADAVGMTKPALYYHFQDKHELFMAVISREMVQGQQVFLQTMSQEATLAARLESGAIWCFTQIGGDIGQMMSDLHRFVPAERVAAFKAEHLQPAELVAQMLKIGQQQGEISPDENIRDLSRLFVSMIFGQLQMLNCEKGSGFDPNRLGKLVARVFMEGVGTSPNP